MLSTSVSIEAPVVVKPLTVSKNASGKYEISPLVINGIQPTSEAKSHVSAATARLSRTESDFLPFLVGKCITAPKIAAVAALSTKSEAHFSPYMTETPNARSKSTASSKSTFPIMLKTDL